MCMSFGALYIVFNSDYNQVCDYSDTVDSCDERKTYKRTEIAEEKKQLGVDWLIQAQELRNQSEKLKCDAEKDLLKELQDLEKAEAERVVKQCMSRFKACVAAGYTTTTPGPTETDCTGCNRFCTVTNWASIDTSYAAAMGFTGLCSDTVCPWLPECGVGMYIHEKCSMRGCSCDKVKCPATTTPTPTVTTPTPAPPSSGGRAGPRSAGAHHDLHRHYYNNNRHYNDSHDDHSDHHDKHDHDDHDDYNHYNHYNRNHHNCNDLDDLDSDNDPCCACPASAPSTCDDHSHVNHLDKHSRLLLRCRHCRRCHCWATIQDLLFGSCKSDMDPEHREDDARCDHQSGNGASCRWGFAEVMQELFLRQEELLWATAANQCCGTRGSSKQRL